MATSSREGTSRRELTFQILTDLYRYLHSKPGKDIRAQMIASFNVWLQLPLIALEVITRVVEMLHTSSLLYLSLSLAC
jgi:geranylgeranyl diphosphate synthase, type III